MRPRATGVVAVTLALAAVVAVRPAGARSLTVEIRHVWNGRPLAIPGGAVTTAAGETLDLTRLSYLLSEPSLQVAGDDGGSRGETWIRRFDWFAHVEVGSDPCRVTLDGLPDGGISSVRFHLGLDEATDRSDPGGYPAGHPLNPVRNHLHWTPQGGFIFLALEGHRLVAEGESTGFAFHLGNPGNRMEVALPVALDAGSGDAVLVVDFHVDRLFDSVPFLRVADRASTHSREGDPVAALLKVRVEHAFTVAELGPAPPDAARVPAAEDQAAHVDTTGTPYRFRVARGFPLPKLPADFPLTVERVELGRILFGDPRLSRTGTLSCASCHRLEAAFADPRRFSPGVAGEVGTRNAMPLFNLAWKSRFFWDGRAASLREQVLMPIEDHREMDETLANVVAKLSADLASAAVFARAFGDPGISPERIGIALEQFLLTLTSFDSRFDRAARGETVLNDLERRGFELFMTEYDPRRGLRGADCFHCHGGAHFTDHRFHDNGLVPTEDPGLEAGTGLASDRHRFATPSLRNVALTAPYMHDGRFATLEEVVAHYDGGLHRSPTLDPNLAKHPRDGLGLSDEDRRALVAFLETLTDPQFAGAGREEGAGGAGAVAGAVVPGDR